VDEKSQSFLAYMILSKGFYFFSKFLAESEKLWGSQNDYALDTFSIQKALYVGFSVCSFIFILR